MSSGAFLFGDVLSGLFDTFSSYSSFIFEVFALDFVRST